MSINYIYIFQYATLLSALQIPRNATKLGSPLNSPFVFKRKTWTISRFVWVIFVQRPYKSFLYHSNFFCDWHSYVRSLINVDNMSFYIWKISLNIVNNARWWTTSTRQFFNYHHHMLLMLLSTNRYIALFPLLLDDNRGIVIRRWWL